jgi:hypothetical protein
MSSRRRTVLGRRTGRDSSPLTRLSPRRAVHPVRPAVKLRRARLAPRPTIAERVLGAGVPGAIVSVPEVLPLARRDRQLTPPTNHPTRLHLRRPPLPRLLMHPTVLPTPIRSHLRPLQNRGGQLSTAELLENRPAI